MNAIHRILVTGGAGFLGSHLCDRLIADGQDVVCVDNFHTGSRRNIGHLVGHPSFSLLEHDVTSPLVLQVGRIFNLACPASPVHYQLDPVRTLETSVLGTSNMLRLAKDVHARILQASTSEVYGDPLVHPQAEGCWGNVNPIGPRSCYDEGKRTAETLCFDYHRQHRVEIKVVRIFNTYGPRMHPEDGRVVSSFIVRALKNEPIPIFGDGAHTRAFCYVDDMIEGIARMMEAPAEFVGPVNIGHPTECTVLELAQRVLRIVGSRSRIAHLPLPQDDPVRRQPDISLASEKLGWAPRVGLDDGLVATIEYFDRMLKSGF